MEYPEDFGQTLELLSNVDLSAIITHRFSLDEFHAALEVARDVSVAGKVMIEFDASED
jgi:threonine dehydrogenase-like Zn-dependent dehydrogenase